ncbi:MAG TPA: signal recognition particle-docking protein FtsY [Candidatus Acidoferrales bacterium]|nr:signal recognition particle-docking protein FtsY [Candidatus Acidoferrales bacterium]
MEKPSFFQRLRNGLARTRADWTQKLESLLGARQWDEESFAAMEEILISADVGVRATERLLEAVRRRSRAGSLGAPADLGSCLREEIVRILAGDGAATSPPRYTTRPWVILFVGVNGVGKTTTIGKFAAQEKQNGRRVLIAAADTFRAAAIDQLEIWGERTGVEVIKHGPGQDPSGVVFDAVQAARKRDIDLVLIDTAGRLHTKVHLLGELKKMRQVIQREVPGGPQETLLVLDASTGQNALQQAKVFNESLSLTGVVLTKLDGTAKGGVVIAIREELKLPVRYIGVGEGVEDLQPFDAELFAAALFSDAPAPA